MVPRRGDAPRSADIDLKATHQEFASFRWIEPREFRLDWTPKFKRNVYRQVMRDFFGLELAD